MRLVRVSSSVVTLQAHLSLVDMLLLPFKYFITKCISSMSFKEEIKVTFVNELMNTSQYSDVILFKNQILQQIAAPNIQQDVKFEFTESKTDEQLAVYTMCLKIVFGFTTASICSTYMSVKMIDFLM